MAPHSHLDNSIIFTPWDSSSKFAVIWLWVEGCWMTQMNVAQSKQTCKSFLARDRERKTWEEQKTAKLQDEAFIKSCLARIAKFSTGCNHQKLGSGFAMVLSLEVRGTCMEWEPKCRYCTQAEFCSCLGWQTKVGRFISAPAFGTFPRVRAANQMCCLSQRDRVLSGMDGSLYFPNLGGKGGKSKLASDSWKFLNLKSWRAMWNWYE